MSAHEHDRTFNFRVNGHEYRIGQRYLDKTHNYAVHVRRMRANGSWEYLNRSVTNKPLTNHAEARKIVDSYESAITVEE